MLTDFQMQLKLNYLSDLQSAVIMNLFIWVFDLLTIALYMFSQDVKLFREKAWAKISLLIFVGLLFKEDTDLFKKLFLAALNIWSDNATLSSLSLFFSFFFVFLLEVSMSFISVALWG